MLGMPLTRQIKAVHVKCLGIGKKSVNASPWFRVNRSQQINPVSQALVLRLLYVQFARRVKVAPPETPYFSVTANTPAQKLASGMEAVFTVTFTPDSEADYSWDLIVCTEREKFVVPLRALGARGQLTLPKTIDFGSSCPCKIEAKLSFLLRNTGRCTSRFQLLTALPFAVAPRSGLLAVGESLQCTVKFTPLSTGPSEGELHVQYETGDVSSVPLHGAGANTDVDVAPTAIQFLKTFVTKMSQKYFKISNRTAMPVRFALKRFGTAEEEQSMVEAEATRLLSQEPGLDKSATAGLQNSEGALEEQEAARKRLAKRLLTQTCSQKYLFDSSIVCARPLEGIVYPDTSIEVCFLVSIRWQVC
jgi:hydrocephalus-inducing protein